MKHTKLIFPIIVCTALFTVQNVFAGCFPRKDAYIELISKEPNTECVFVGLGSSCIGMLDVHIRNYCEDVLIYKDKKLHNYNENITKNIPVSVTLSDVPQKIGDRWNEVLYYENNPNKKIILSFEVKAKKDNTDKKNKDGVQIVGLNLLGYVFAILVFSVIFFFLFKKRKK